MRTTVADLVQRAALDLSCVGRWAVEVEDSAWLGMWMVMRAEIGLDEWSLSNIRGRRYRAGAGGEDGS